MAILNSYVPVINNPSSILLGPANNEAFIVITSSTNEIIILPQKDTVPLGYYVVVFNASSSPSTLIIQTSSLEPNINYRNSLGMAVNTNTLTVLTYGAVTVSRGGNIGQAVATPWQAAGDIL
jgi:hypothetical protein